MKNTLVDGELSQKIKVLDRPQTTFPFHIDNILNNLKKTSKTGRNIGFEDNYFKLGKSQKQFKISISANMRGESFRNTIVLIISNNLPSGQDSGAARIEVLQFAIISFTCGI